MREMLFVESVAQEVYGQERSSSFPHRFFANISKLWFMGRRLILFDRTVRSRNVETPEWFSSKTLDC